jgi:hypothetical protein
MTDMERRPLHSIWIVEYARAFEAPAGDLVHGRHNAGVTTVPYCFAVIKSNDHLILVDCGYRNDGVGVNLATAAGVTVW